MSGISIERLKEDVSIEAVLAYLGAKTSDWSHGSYDAWVAVSCPFHDDTNASASMNRAKGRFRCHACDVSGDIIDLAKEELGTTDTRQAMDWLERTFT